MSGTNQTVAPVTYDDQWWRARYPELAEWTSPAVAENYFGLAQGMLVGGVCDVPTQQRLLGLLTAHIVKLFAPVGGEAPSGLVGRISNASEGSVSVATDFPANPSAAWFNQTTYGAMYWQATGRYRTFRYFPGPQPFLEGRRWRP